MTPDLAAPRLDLTRLASFLVLVDERQFSRAAKRLIVAQPTLTARIAGLERSLGVPLIDRSVGEFALTEAGKRLAEVGGRLLDLEASIVSSVLIERPSEELRLVATTVVDPAVLASASHDFLQARCRVKLSTSIAPFAEVVDAVARSAADIGVVHLGPSVPVPSGVVVVPLRSEPLMEIEPTAAPTGVVASGRASSPARTPAASVIAASVMAVPSDLAAVVAEWIDVAVVVDAVPSEREVVQRVALGGERGLVTESFFQRSAVGADGPARPGGTVALVALLSPLVDARGQRLLDGLRTACR